MNILVLGAGKVGLPIASALVDRQHGVWVVDTNAALVDGFVQGVNPIPCEPDGRISGISFSTNIPNTYPDVAYIIVPTPEENGKLLSKYVIQARDEIRAHFKDLFIIVGSTLDPADVPLVFTDSRMAYSPPLIRLGHVVQDFLEVSLRLVGIQSESDLSIMKSFYADSPLYRRSLAECRYIIGDPLSIAIAKLAINTSLSLKVAWANEVHSVVQALGADSRVVFETLHAEPRIQIGYSGWPPSGPCLPRDLEVWTSMASSPLIERAKIVHRAAVNKIIADTVRMISEIKNPRVAVLGVTYNPNAMDITNSQGLAIANELFSNGCYVRIYDPAFGVVVPKAHRLVSLRASSAKEAIRDANVVIITTAWDEFKSLDYSGRFVIDLTRKV